MKTQEFTSKSTSINANRLPVVFSTITNKAAALNIDLENTMVLDSGCGAFPGIISKHFEDRGAGYAGRDPYNQPESVNAEFIPAANKALRAGQDRIFTSSNVLNVICAAKFRAAYLESIAEIMRPGEKLYITVYEGDRSGNAGPSGEDSWQENRKYKSYLPEVVPFFSDVTTKYGMIIATK